MSDVARDFTSTRKLLTLGATTDDLETCRRVRDEVRADPAFFDGFDEDERAALKDVYSDVAMNLRDLRAAARAQPA